MNAHIERSGASILPVRTDHLHQNVVPHDVETSVNGIHRQLRLVEDSELLDELLQFAAALHECCSEAMRSSARPLVAFGTTRSAAGLERSGSAFGLVRSCHLEATESDAKQARTRVPGSNHQRRLAIATMS